MTTEDRLNELMTEIIDAFTLNRPLLPVLMNVAWANMTLTFYPEDITRPYLMKARLEHGTGRHAIYKDVLVDTETVLQSAFYAKPKPTAQGLLDTTDVPRNFFAPEDV